MKKFLITALALLFVLLAADYAYYRLGFYIDLHPNQPVTTFMTTDEDTIYMDTGSGPEPFVIKGVNMGVGIPGCWATDYAIDRETYLRWFQQIQDMGANTLRVYTILHSDFYDAFYAYNQNNDNPLYLIHGVWVNDYIHNSRLDAYSDDFRLALLQDCRTLVDLLHGNKKLSISGDLGSGTYNRDVSQWVIGYILGVEWEDITVTYTNHKFPELPAYQGTYFSATQDATAFESLLAEVGDQIVSYESQRYKQQRLVAFSNWPTTDPFIYPEDLTTYFMKCTQLDVEHIKASDAFLSGQFASYHVYPYYPDYMNYILNPVELEARAVWSGKELRIRAGSDSGTPYQEALTGDLDADYLDSQGRVNTYYAYLQMLTRHHSMPVVISEFGVSTGRGMAQLDQNTNRNQGHMSETEQGQALVSMWADILDSGCAGGCVFTWQDEWFKRTWNTMHAVDLQKTPYWSDYQTNEQYFGLLSFDPGDDQSICYVDGDLSEWTQQDMNFGSPEASISMKYDEKFLYLLIHKQGLAEGAAPLYVPIDTTPKSGSTDCRNYGLSFQRDADFLLVIDGQDNSRLLVQERYQVLRAMFSSEVYKTDAFVDPPAKDSPVFKRIELVLQTATPLLSGVWDASSEVYETGLLTYGNANPDSPEYNSLADFHFAGDYVEVKLPWQLLNFSNPSEMMIHDDYYEHYGIEDLHIREIWAGLGTVDATIPMGSFPLQGWGSKITYHERLKPSYYIMQSLWTGGNDHAAQH